MEKLMLALLIGITSSLPVVFAIYYCKQWVKKILDFEPKEFVTMGNIIIVLAVVFAVSWFILLIIPS